MAAQRNFDRRDELAALERLDDVGKRAGVAGLFDQVALGVGGEHQDGGEAVAGDLASGGQPVEARHADIEDGEIGLEIPHERDGFVAATGLTHDFITLFFEGLLEVEADDGLVFSDHDADGHGTPRAGLGRAG